MKLNIRKWRNSSVEERVELIKQHVSKVLKGAAL